MLTVSDDDDALTLGCLEAIWPGGHVTLIVPPSRHLSIATLSRSSVAANLTRRLGQLDALPFPDGTFDRIVGLFAPLQLAVLAAVVPECRRVARPGGRIALAWTDVSTTLPEMVLRQNGFVAVEEDRLPGFQFAVGRRIARYPAGDPHGHQSKADW